MIAAAILTVLIIQTSDGLVTVQENLSDHACKEAVCVALHGKTCVEHAMSEYGAKVLDAKRVAKWRASPHQPIAYAGPRICSSPIFVGDSLNPVSGGPYTRIARCVR